MFISTFSKISVAGEDKHPLYQALTTAQPERVGEGPFRERLEGLVFQLTQHQKFYGTLKILSE